MQKQKYKMISSQDKPKSSEVDNLSDYEKIRAKNIEENKRFLAKLKLQQSKN